VYDKFEKVVLVHGVRYESELAYQGFIREHLPSHEYFGEVVREKLIYDPTVTREKYANQGRLTDLIRSGKLMRDVGLPALNTDDDRFMICGSPSMLKDSCALLNSAGFQETRAGVHGHYVIERAFVEH